MLHCKCGIIMESSDQDINILLSTLNTSGKVHYKRNSYLQKFYYYLSQNFQPIPELYQNGAITGYTIMYRISGSLQNFTVKEVTGAANSDLLTGLSPWTTYEVKVQGVNRDGTGPSSESAAAKTLADGKLINHF